MKRTNYLVSWEIEIEAENEKKAVEVARSLLEGKDSDIFLRQFYVQSSQGEVTRKVEVDQFGNIDPYISYFSYKSYKTIYQEEGGQWCKIMTSGKEK